jgi:glutamate:GABA antiporter
VLIPGGKIGVWVAGGLGFLVTLGGIALSFVPPGESASKYLFSVKLISGTVISVALGLILYYRGVRAKARDAAD